MSYAQTPGPTYVVTLDLSLAGGIDDGMNTVPLDKGVEEIGSLSPIGESGSASASEALSGLWSRAGGFQASPPLPPALRAPPSSPILSRSVLPPPVVGPRPSASALVLWPVAPPALPRGLTQVVPESKQLPPGAGAPPAGPGIGI